MVPYCKEKSKQSIPLVFNIQKFSIHDGPGIRTTIFFKGCPMCCPWCHNPESQHFQQEQMTDSINNSGIVGEAYSVEELVKKAEQDIIFYEKSGGGVTLSGGEVMAQNMEYIIALVQRLQAKGITVGIDTSGFVSYNQLEQIRHYVDFFLYDIKLFDKKKHEEYIGVDNTLILDNFKRLHDTGAVMYLRLIMIEGINVDEKDDILPLIHWLKSQQIVVKKIHLLPYHEWGKNKYARLGRRVTIFKKPSEKKLAHIQDEFKKIGYETVIGG